MAGKIGCSVIAGIYKITCKVNGKVYIGKSKNIFQRWKAQIYELNGGVYRDPYFRDDFARYGIENFIFEVIERVDDPEADLKDIERRYILEYQSHTNGYNRILT